MDPLIKEWTLFLDRCLEFRIRPELFEATAAQLYGKSPLPGRKLANLLLRPRTAAASSIDPLIIIYAEHLLAANRIDASDVLVSAFQFSRDRPPRAGEDQNPVKDNPSRWYNPPELEEILFQRLQKAFSTGKRPATNEEAVHTVAMVSRWMSAMVTSHTNDSMIQAMAGIQQHPHQQSINLREGLGMLVVGLIENGRILQLLSKQQVREVQKAFSLSLTRFISFLSQTSPQISNRLEISQKEHDFDNKDLATVNGGVNENASMEVVALQLEAVMELPVLNTRAGLYIFLNSLLVARPLTDDFLITSYLHSRCKVDTQHMVTDLITAAFDVLANAMYRSETSQTIFCLKSFLMNKVPILATTLSTSIFPMTVELSITQALNHIDPNAFPAFSQGFDDMLGNNNSLSDVRHDFLNTCTLHGLLPKDMVERLLGEAPMQGPPETRYIKKDLLTQCKDNFEKVHTFIDELENLDGNAGAIVGALTEFITHLCETQMSMYLKTICNLLFKKLQVLDVILQFTSPAILLRPLCQFLDEWRYESDQGEYQPVYDEFGAILLLILAFVHRYDMTYHDLGIGQDSFVAQLLDRGHHSIAPDDLTEEQGKQLCNWLRGLYDVDKEGLSNDVFSSCRPQDFYLIVPTLFSQTIAACSAEVLSLDTVKGGLEYLHETFLLPSLFGALTWMASHALKQTHQDLDVQMQIFDKLIRSANTSGYAQTMHATILSLASSRLEKCFRTLKRRYPSRTDIEPLLQAIKSSLNHERPVYSSMAELEQWTSNTNNTLYTSLRQTIQQLTQWASATALLNPPSYTHRQIYTSIKVLGASRTLRAIIDEVKTQTEAGFGAAALDIGVSIICAPTVEDSVIPSAMIPIPPPRTHMNLREMLKAEYDNAASMMVTDPSAAETTVRLHRRVEAQLLSMSQTSISATQLDIPHVSMINLPTQSTELDKALNDAASAAASMAVAGGELDQANQQALQQTLDLDLSAAGGALDLSGINVEVPGTGDMSAAMENLPDLGDLGGMGMDLGEDDDAWGLDFDNM